MNKLIAVLSISLGVLAGCAQPGSDKMRQDGMMGKDKHEMMMQHEMMMKDCKMEKDEMMMKDCMMKKEESMKRTQ